MALSHPHHILFVLLLILALVLPLQAAEMIAPGIARFQFPETEDQQPFPSLALQHEFPRIGEVPEQWQVTPEWTKTNGTFTASIKITNKTSLYGTGEIPGPLLRNGFVTECWNTDSYKYTRQYNRLYQSHPWVLAVRPNGTAFGVLADTTRRCKINLRDGIQFSVQDSAFPVIVIDRKSPQAVLRGLAELTGTMPLPPRWALGYHQCRWSYYPEKRIREIAGEFRTRRIPCDVIWFDIDYMDGFRIFTFDQSRFPDPAKLNGDLHDMGFHTIWMIDPGVKADPEYAVYNQGNAGNHWVQTAEEKTFIGKVWPGGCAFPDFTRPETRAWWSTLYKDFMATGIDGVWNDMNEPAVFDGPNGTMPLNNIHRGGGNLPRGTHTDYHNVYGMLMVRASREGILAANPNKRPFLLTRANYIGGQRYAATWTGDNQSNWKHLQDSIPMALNLGISGQPFSGPDIGGFEGTATPQLFARWMGFGALLPFARGHAAKGTPDKEPWSFGEETENTCRLALQRRYRLLPYLYTQFRECSRTGVPVMQPVFFADPTDPALYAEDHAFLLGPDLLVLPQLDERRQYSHAVPKGIWRTFTLVDGEQNDNNQPELRIRGGAIIPLGPIVETTSKYKLEPLTLIVCLNKNGTAKGQLYEDEGDGFGYRNGEFRVTEYTARKTEDGIEVTANKIDGNWPVADREVLVRLVTEDGVMGSDDTKDNAIHFQRR